jgi:hypothetical protein
MTREFGERIGPMIKGHLWRKKKTIEQLARELDGECRGTCDIEDFFRELSKYGAEVYDEDR